MTDQTTADSSNDTREHIARVAFYLGLASDNFMKRAALHDASKLDEPEKSAFDRLKGRLAQMKYGSEEYRACLRAEKPAIDHHYAQNSHHPEYWQKRDGGMIATMLRVSAEEQKKQAKSAGPEEQNAAGLLLKVSAFNSAAANELEAQVNNMSLFDVLEMLTDWKAASERMADGGDIAFSIKHNIERFSLSPQLASILVNTAIEFAWIDRAHAIAAGVLPA